MNKLNHIEAMLESVRDDKTYSDEDKQFMYGRIDDAVSACVTYHNEAVDQGRLLTLARFRMDMDDYIAYVERLHERRKEMHKAMIDHTAVLNQICRMQNLPDIYTGPLDTTKGRKDDDTRFGVAEFGEELCRDLFKTTHEIGVPEKAKAAYLRHSSRIVNEGGNWSKLQRIIENADAKANMDAGEIENPYR